MLVCFAAAAGTGLVLAFLASTGIVERHHPGLTERLAMLKAAQPAPNVVFVGTSLTVSGIIPAVVDSAAAAEGCELRTMNLAVNASDAFENAFLIDQIAKQRMPDDLIIAFEPASYEKYAYSDLGGSYIRNPAIQLKYLPEVLAEAPPEWPARLAVLGNYLRARLAGFFGLHVLHDAFLEEMQPKRRKVSERGFAPAHSQERRDKFLSRKGLDRFWKRIANWDMDRPKGSAALALLHARRIEAAGFRPVAFAAPVTTAGQAADVLAAQAKRPDLWTISVSKDALPELFSDARFWHDGYHVERVGAEVVSDYVGRQLCSLVKRG